MEQFEMKCGVNTLPFERGGGITYLKNVLPRLEDTEGYYYIFVPSDRRELEKKYENMEYIEVDFPTGNLFLRLIYEQIILPFVLIQLDIDIYYSPTGITTLLSPCPTVNAIRDPNPFVQHSERPWKEQLKRRGKRLLIRLSVWKSTKSIFVSRYTKNIVSKHFSVNDEKSHIVYHGINRHEFKNVNEVNDPDVYNTLQKLDSYILCVSTIYKHKNYESLIVGFSELSKSFQNRYPLVIAGGYSRQKYYNRIVQLVEEEGVADNVIFLGKVDYEDIPYLYNHSTVAVLPSKLETFGHPLVEAMAAGTPLVAANAACIPEITDNAALLFDPDDPTDLAKCLQKVLLDEQYRKYLIKAGDERVKDFSWEQTTEKTYFVLKQATNEQ